VMAAKIVVLFAHVFLLCQPIVGAY
jgi:hypothetical protein